MPGRDAHFDSDWGIFILPDSLKVYGQTEKEYREALFVNHCGSCHNWHLPEQYTRQLWEKEIPEMQQKAKISIEDAKVITSFIFARSKPY